MFEAERCVEWLQELHSTKIRTWADFDLFYNGITAIESICYEFDIKVSNFQKEYTVGNQLITATLTFNDNSIIELNAHVDYSAVSDGDSFYVEAYSSSAKEKKLAEFESVYWNY